MRRRSVPPEVLGDDPRPGAQQPPRLVRSEDRQEPAEEVRARRRAGRRRRGRTAAGGLARPPPTAPSQATASARTIRAFGPARPVSPRFSAIVVAARRSRSTNVARAAPRDSASIPAAPLPAHRSRNADPAELGLEDREEGLLHPVGERPGPLPRRDEPASPGRPGDDPAGVSHRSPCDRPAAGRPRGLRSPRLTRRSPARRRRSPRASRPRARGGAAPSAGAERSSPPSSSSASAWRRASVARTRWSGALERGHPQPGQTALGQAQDVALAAELEVGLGQLEPVEGPGDRHEPGLLGRLGGPPAGHEVAPRTRCSGRRPRRGRSTRRRRPRPTRPRSWWSWASPNRSAPSTAMTVASGTSTPTSTTVVPTRTSSRRPPSRKRVISASRSAAFIGRGRARPGAGRAARASRSASAFAATAPSSSRLLDRRDDDERPVAASPPGPGRTPTAARDRPGDGSASGSGSDPRAASAGR